METDASLDTLIRRRDHLNVLRYVRVHQIRDPRLVIQQGQLLLGNDLNRKLSDELARLAALEQICLAAFDLENNDGDGDNDNNNDDDDEYENLAELCLTRLKQSGISGDAPRFRILLGRSLEAAEDYDGAEQVYDDLLITNPSNLMALKRKYCICKSQVGKQQEAIEALNQYVQQNYTDTAAWYEMSKLRAELGDYKGAAFALEETLLGIPSDSKIHCELGEYYATIGGSSSENLILARKHMCQSLELDPNNRRALFGLVSVANAYLDEFWTSSSNKRTSLSDTEEHEAAVARELVKYGAENLLKQYKGTGSMFSSVKALMSEYTEDL